MGKRIETVINLNGADMYKFGNIALTVTEEELRKVFDFGDILRVTIENVGSLVMPFFRYYDDVRIGELVLCTYTKGSYAMIARNYKAIGVELGLLEADEQNKNFHFCNTSSSMHRITIELEGRPKEAAPHNSEAYIRIGERVCDFRMITGGAMRENVFFRSSSPIDGRLSDNSKVDVQVEKAGIKSVIDLADTKAEAEQFTDFNKTYCSKCKTVYLNMPLDVTSTIFKNVIRTGIEFIAENEPPYLVFCSEGRDRTGLFVALLQALFGTDLSRIISDYVFSFELRCDGKLSEQTLCNIEYSVTSSLCSALEVNEIAQKDLQNDTEKFMLSTGISPETIYKVKSKIGVKA